MTDIVPCGETRSNYFFEGEAEENQDAVLSDIKINAANYLIVSRLEKVLDLGEFKKVASLIGKPKFFYSIARYSENMWRQVVIGFDNPIDKRYFQNVFRLVFPDYLVQEMSKITKYFCMSQDSVDSELEWKELFQRKFKAETVFVSNGADVLATDYRLSKLPLMQKFMPLKTIVVEFSSPGLAFEMLLYLNEASIQHEKCINLFLFGMFEADEEQKALVIEKKEQQKIEDDAEKCEKHIDNYLTKQMAMQMSPDQIKEQGLDKANSQTKSFVYFKNLGEHARKHQVHECTQQLEQLKAQIHPKFPRDLHALTQCHLYYKEALKTHSPFNRYNEPILFTTMENVQKYWDYDHLKYNNKRDPTTDELVAAVQNFNHKLTQDILESKDACSARVEKCVDEVCCVTHATSLHFLNKDPKNICREVNKLLVSSYFKELNSSPIGSTYDQTLVYSDVNKQKLNAIMPILNSVSLWGRYKQKFDKHDTFYHMAPYLRQTYEKDTIYRNVNWVYGLPDNVHPSKFGGQSLYEIQVPGELQNSLIRFKDQGIKCLPPFQVLIFLEEGEIAIPEELPLRVLKVFKFQVCADYKDYVTWKRKDVIKGKQ